MSKKVLTIKKTVTVEMFRMTNQEAIEILKTNKGLKDYSEAMESMKNISIENDSFDYLNAIQLAIKALMYQDIYEQREKPMKPLKDKHINFYYCPKCGGYAIYDPNTGKGYQYCGDCGQKLKQKKER